MVSPAVTAMDSVPPLQFVSKIALVFCTREPYYAKEAVTKTEAKPPIPSTNGASPV